jgi:hypothetical protein
MSNSVDINALLTGAVDEGAIGNVSLNILQGVDDIGNRIQAGLGTPADAITASEVILVRVLVDDSPSMSGDPQMAAITGYGSVIDALLDSKQKSGILFGADLLNGGMVCPYTPLDQAIRLDHSNYRLTGLTPLFDRTLATLKIVLTKTMEFSDNGVPVRTVTCIATDGFDNQSQATAAKVATVVKDMLKGENHIICAMGICERTNDATELNRRQQQFRDVFETMGILPQWMLTPANSPSEIRKAFAVFSNSAVRASQNAANFSQTLVAGFGN